MSSEVRLNGRLGGPAAQGFSGAWAIRREQSARRRRPPRGLRDAVSRGFALTLALLGLTIFSAPSEAESNTLEYAVKAAYLFKFTPFVEWPSSAFAAPTSPFYVCGLGDDPFGPNLDQALNGGAVGDHPLKARRIQALDDADQCQILYLGAASAQATTAALNRVRGAPVLTVTEQSAGVSGGVIQFVVRDGHVRFNIDTAAAAANKVVISAKLLSLAAAFQARS